jgi:hypothetical protein
VLPAGIVKTQTSSGLMKRLWSRLYPSVLVAIQGSPSPLTVADGATTTQCRRARGPGPGAESRTGLGTRLGWRSRIHLVLTGCGPVNIKVLPVSHKDSAGLAIAVNGTWRGTLARKHPFSQVSGRPAQPASASETPVPCQPQHLRPKQSHLQQRYRQSAEDLRPRDRVLAWQPLFSAASGALMRHVSAGSPALARRTRARRREGRTAPKLAAGRMLATGSAGAQPKVRTR